MDTVNTNTGQDASPFTGILSPDRIHSSPQDRKFEIDGKRPAFAVFPCEEKEVQDILRICKERGLSCIPSGGGTKLDAGNPPSSYDVAVSLERMDSILEHDAGNLTVTAQAGARLARIQSELAREKQFLPVDAPCSETATIGGVVASASSGYSRYGYGAVRDLVLGMKVVLPDGRVVKAGGKVVKNVSGYDMCKLFTGSYGTLGIITEVTMRLLPLPEETGVIACDFARKEDSARAARSVRSKNICPTAILVLSPRPGNLNPGALFPEDKWRMLVRFDGAFEAIERQIADTIQAADCAAFIAPYKGSAADDFWQVLTAFSPEHDRGAKHTVVSFRATVLLSKTEAFVDFAESVFRNRALKYAMICDWGCSILHGRILLPGRIRDMDVETASGCIRQVRDEAEKFGGHLTVMSAPRQIKTRLVKPAEGSLNAGAAADVWGNVTNPVNIMKALKKKFDPSGTLSPGRFAAGI